MSNYFKYAIVLKCRQVLPSCIWQRNMTANTQDTNEWTLADSLRVSSGWNCTLSTQKPQRHSETDTVSQGKSTTEETKQTRKRDAKGAILFSSE